MQTFIWVGTALTSKKSQRKQAKGGKGEGKSTAVAAQTPKRMPNKTNGGGKGKGKGGGKDWHAWYTKTY